MFNRKHLGVVWMALAIVAGGTAAYMTSACDPYYSDPARISRAERQQAERRERARTRLINELKAEVDRKIDEARPRIRDAMLAGACDLAAYQIRLVGDIGRYNVSTYDAVLPDVRRSTGMGWDMVSTDALDTLFRQYYEECASGCGERVTVDLSQPSKHHAVVQKGRAACLRLEAPTSSQLAGVRVRTTVVARSDARMQFFVPSRFGEPSLGSATTAVLDASELPYRLEARFIPRCRDARERCSLQEERAEDMGSIEVDLEFTPITAPSPAAQVTR